jgi:hypothetical protein
VRPDPDTPETPKVDLADLFGDDDLAGYELRG